MNIKFIKIHKIHIKFRFVLESHVVDAQWGALYIRRDCRSQCICICLQTVSVNRMPAAGRCWLRQDLNPTGVEYQWQCRCRIWPCLNL